MKVILYAAISADGYIATLDGNSEWVSEMESTVFQKRAGEIGCIVIGRKTFEQYKDILYPMQNVTTIVLSHAAGDEHREVLFVASPEEAVRVAESKGYTEILVSGGGTVNGSFMQKGLVDELILDVEPVVMGTGMGLFNDAIVKGNLELLGTKQLSQNELQLHYKVIR